MKQNPLAAYLERSGVTPPKFAKRIEVSAQAVRLWCRGQRIPGLEMMRVIEKATGGAVKGPALVAWALDHAA